MSSIVILATDSPYTYLAMRELVSSSKHQISAVILSNTLVGTRKGLDALWFGLRKISYVFALKKILEERNTVKELCRRHGIPIYYTSNINTDIELLEKVNPELVVSVYFNQYIGTKVSSRYRCLNVHPSLLPKGRGLFSYFWNLLDGEREAGVTVHVVDEHFDTGSIVIQQPVEIKPNDTIRSLYTRCSEVASRLLAQAIDMLNEGFTPVEQSGESSYHTYPTNMDYLRFFLKGKRYG